MGIEIFSLSKGKVLYQKNPQHRFIPSSSIKLFVAAAALDLLGPEFTFQTKLFSDGKIAEGKLEGDLYLVGGGDPSLLAVDLEELASQLKKKGIEKIEGDLFFDLSLFDQVSQGPGWMWDEEPAFWCAPLSPLNVEHNCVEITIHPRGEDYKHSLLSFAPSCDYIDVKNELQVQVGKKGKDFKIALKKGEKKTVFQVQGKIGSLHETVSIKMPVKKPGQYAASLFRFSLQKKGILFSGKTRMKALSKNATLLAMHHSPPLKELLKSVLKESDNLYANTFFKFLGMKKFSRPGTWEKGGRATLDFLSKRVGLDTKEMVIVDGDGESRYNLVSPHQMVTFLRWAHQNFPYAKEFQEALPRNGIDGTLKGRLKSASLIGRLAAKTGTMTGNSSLCGFIQSEKGEELAFAILIGGFVKRCAEVKSGIEDSICTLLIEKENDS